VLQEVQPDLVHALRLFQEGEMAGLSDWRPLIISVWGQDLTIEARLSPLHGWLARNALSQADAVTADNKRDLELAFEWGRRLGTTGELFLSSGGIRSEIFYPGEPDQTLLQQFVLDTNSLVILSPRGLRPGYIRLSTLFEAIPKVARVYPQVRFVQLEIPNQAIAESYGLAPASMPFIRLLRRASQDVLAELMRGSTLMVSPAIKDGTPNSFFECMACGVVPIVPNITPYPEWIKHGQNGMFFDPYDAEDLARVIIQAIDSPLFLERAREMNLELVSKWAARDSAMARAEALYRSVLCHGKIE
jgi:glycosyltransferase involved in cell wall biosynthesis